MALEIPRKVWTREEAHALADSGLLPNASKLELVLNEPEPDLLVTLKTGREYTTNPTRKNCG